LIPEVFSGRVHFVLILLLSITYKNYLFLIRSREAEKVNNAKHQRRSHDKFAYFRVAQTLPTKAQLREEFNELFHELEATKSPLVFCHNDLLLGNVVYTGERNSVTFIDYEYAEINFQEFDIGNHFAEFPGIGDEGIDYSLYPSPDYQRAWIRVYLEEYKESSVSEAEVETMYKNCNKFALSSHFLWALWSLIQAENSTIDFDFVA
jgi:ethanolamine kinase